MNVEKIKNINNITVLVFGDYMVDSYINGDVKRISPEAPVPVVEIKNRTKKLGGAGNVINNIISFGAKVKAIGCIGDDENGHFIKEEFNKMNIDDEFFGMDKNVCTIVKTRITAKKQQFLRLDEEQKKPLPKEYYDYVSENLSNVFEGVDSLVISDYAKGAVNENFCQLLIEKAKLLNVAVIIDPKGTDYKKYKGATVLTPNLKELNDYLQYEVHGDTALTEAGFKLREDCGIGYLALTRSEKGITLFSEGSREDFPALAKDVIDVTGAGDTVVATIATLMPLGFSMPDLCNLANQTASVVVSKFGAATCTLDELMATIEDTGEFKLISLDTAKYIVEDLKNKGKTVVFTNGCFDLIHAGHLYSFKYAKSLGDVLIVAVNSDASVKKNKGDQRPIINQDDRIKMICELECVDYVILMEDSNPVNIIKNIKPNISVKGEDWKNKNVPEQKILESYGGKIEFIPLYQGKSTTNIIEKILKVYGSDE